MGIPLNKMDKTRFEQELRQRKKYQGKIHQTAQAVANDTWVSVKIWKIEFVNYNKICIYVSQ